MKILAIEDNEVLLKTVEFKFKKEGFTTLTSNNGKDAIEKIQNFKPDLIITDINMPFMSGLEVISFVRNDLNSKIPIIVLSSVGLEKTVLEAFAMGATDYITKPFSPNELLTRVHKLLPKYVAEEEIPEVEVKIEEDRKKKIEEIRATIESLMEQEKKLWGADGDNSMSNSLNKTLLNSIDNTKDEDDDEYFVPKSKRIGGGSSYEKERNSSRYEDDEMQITKARIQALEEKEEEENKLSRIRNKFNTLKEKLFDQERIIEREEDELISLRAKIKDLMVTENELADKVNHLKSKSKNLKDELREMEKEEEEISKRIDRLRDKIKELREKSRY
jgi:DNA-binding response OmpR family regulator